MAFGSAYGAPPGAVVQVVELADAGDPGQRHLGVHGGARPGRSRGRGGRRRRTSRSRQVQNVPPPAVRAAAQRAVEGVASARWRSPGSIRPGSRGVAGRGARRARSVNRPSAISNVTSAARPSGARPAGPRPARGAPQPARGHRGHRSVAGARSARAISRGERRRPRRRSRRRRRARSGRARPRWGCARRASRSGTPAAARTPASCPAPVGSSGASPSSAASRRASAGSNGVRSVQRLLGERRPPSARDVRATTAAHAARRPSPRASSQAVTCDGMALTPFGATCDLAAGGDGAVALGRGPRRPAPTGEGRASGRRGRPAGWCRRGWPGRRSRSRQRPCGQIAVPDRDRRGRGRPAPAPCSTCSSTKRADPRPAPPGPGRQRPASSPAARRPRPASRRRRRRSAGGPLGGRARRSAAASPRRPRRTARPPRRRSRPRRRARGAEPAARSTSSAANALTTPSGPSNAPPSGTESRC